MIVDQLLAGHGQEHLDHKILTIARTREAATKAILVANPGLVKGIARRRLEQVTGP